MRTGTRLNSLRVRLLLPIGTIVVVSIALTLLLAAYLTRQAAESAARHDLSHEAGIIAGQQRKSVCSLCPEELSSLRAELAPLHERVVVAPLREPTPYLTRAEQAALLQNKPVDARRRIDGVDSFFSAQEVSSRGKQWGFLVVRKAKLQDTGPFVESLLFAAIAGAVLAFGAAILLARLIAGRIEHVSTAIRAFADEESPSQLAVEGPNELASLAASFNHMADELARAREAERAFLLSVSHELKTPLTSIRGYAEALAEDAVDVGQAAETLRAEAGRLERLVHDLLDLARINRSRFDVRREPVELGEAALDSVRRHERLAQTLGVTLEAHLDAPAQVLGDGDRVQQIIGNLVENALRVTPVGGGVRVCVEGGEVRVEDDGPGLKQDELPRAFERFYLHSRYGKERKVGTGLGLAIVKQLAEAMGGRVGVSSVEGEGTSFTLRLPLLEPSDAVLRPAYPRRTAG